MNRPASWAERVNAYRETGEGFPTRKAYLQFLANGPDGYTDVEAARSLLAKPRYKDAAG